MRSALVAMASAQATLTQAEATRDVAEKNAEEAAALYARGLTTALAVSDADAKLFEAEVELIRQRYGLAIAYLDLRAAAGRDPVGKEPLL